MSILLVEDERDLAELWCEYLRAKGHRIRVAHSVREAHASLTQKLPQLLIVDYRLADGDARDVLRALDTVAEAAQPHVVVCSGHGNDLPEPLRARTHEILSKPFRLEQLDAVIARWARPSENVP